MIGRCPEKSYGRLTDKDNRVRRDLCRHHLESTMKFYNTDEDNPQVFVAEIWGE